MGEGQIERVRRVAGRLASQGRVDEAVQACMDAGDLEGAAQVLMNAKRFKDAGHLLLEEMAVMPHQVGQLDKFGKRLALKAGICLAHAGQTSDAVAVFRGLGEVKRAADVLERAGDHVGAAALLAGGKKARAGGQKATGGTDRSRDEQLKRARELEKSGQLKMALEAYMQAKHMGAAGRVLRKMGRTREAAALFVTIEMPYEAGVCFEEAGRPKEALEQLISVSSRDSKRYRDAARRGARLAVTTDRLDYQVDQFLSHYVRAGLKSKEDLAVFYALGLLYEKHDFSEVAIEIYGRILQAAPGYKDVAQRQAYLQDKASRVREQDKRLLAEDARVLNQQRQLKADSQMASELPGLPPLPGLPGLPPLPGVGGQAGTIAMPGGVPVPRAPGAVETAKTIAGVGVDRPVDSVGPAPVGTAVPAPKDAADVLAGVMNDGGLAAAVQGRGISSGIPPKRESAPAGAKAAPDGETGARAASVGGEGAGEQDPEQIAEALVAGVVINERYQVQRKLGQGGMAAVFEAVDMELDDRVAIKLFTQQVDDETLIKRFKRELLLSRKLAHPNVVRLFDIGTYRGLKFISMELLAGSDLEELVENEGALELSRGLKFFCQAASGLAAVHDQGIVHRDVKSANMFVTTGDELKVMDFGLAKGSEVAGTKTKKGHGLTQEGFLAGTPNYIAPEQIRSFAHATHLADIYSLGVVAYEMFTGTLPFENDELMGLLVMHMTETPEPPRVRNPGIPVELNDLILMMLNKAPDARVQTCHEVERALRGMAAFPDEAGCR